MTWFEQKNVAEVMLDQFWAKPLRDQVVSAFAFRSQLPCKEFQDRLLNYEWSHRRQPGIPADSITAPDMCGHLGPFSHSQTNLLVEKRHVFPAEPYSNCKITSTKMVSIVSLNMGVVCYTVIYY